MSVLAATGLVRGTTIVDDPQLRFVRTTYLLVNVPILFAVLGGYLGMHAEPLLYLFYGKGAFWMFVGSLVLLNLIPFTAPLARRITWKMGIPLLALDGLLSGLALTPLLIAADQYHQEGGSNLIVAALGMTLAVFLGVTCYVLFSGRRFCGPFGVLSTLFWILTVSGIVTWHLDLGLFGVLLTVLSGVFGVYMLLRATSWVIHEEDFDLPVQAALLIYSGLFNLFESSLRFLLHVAAHAKSD